MKSGAVLLILSAPAFAQEVTVPFEPVKGFVVVKVELNGKGPFTFAFDTGAPSTVLHPTTARTLGYDLSSNESRTTVSLRSIALGKAMLQDHHVLAARLPQFDAVQEAFGLRFEGVLGYGFISRFVTTLDYGAKTIKLVPSRYRPEPILGAEAPAGRGWIGFSPRELGADEANEIGVDGGVVVQKIAKGSPAERAGLREKDLIQEVGGSRILKVDDYLAAVRKTKPGEVSVFRVIRDRKDMEIKVTVGEKK